MRPDVRKIPLPFSGLSDAYERDSQPTDTTYEASNVRPINPSTGRRGISQREGLTRESDTQVSGSNAVRVIQQVTTQRKRVTYSVETDSVAIDENEVWKKAHPGGGQAQAGVVDRFGNIYTTHQKTQIAKWNPQGGLVWTVEVPVVEPGQRIRPIAIDDLGGVYTGVTDGNQGATTFVWRFAPEENDKPPVVDWAIELDGFLADLKVRNSRLYILDNVTEEVFGAGEDVAVNGTAKLKVYNNLTLSPPTLLWSRAVPFPASQVDVNDGGEAFVASLINTNRNNFGENLICWPDSIYDQPSDIVGSANLWCHLDAEALDGYADGDSVTFWPDKTGNERNLWRVNGSGENVNAPEYRAASICNKPSIYFDGSAGLWTQPGDDDQDVGSFTLFRGVNDTEYVTFWIFRPDRLPNTTGVLFEQQGEARVRCVTNADKGSGSDFTQEQDRLYFRAGPVSLGNETGEDTFHDGGLGSGSGGKYLDDVVILVFEMKGDDTANSRWRVNGADAETGITVSSDQMRHRTHVGFPSSVDDIKFDGTVPGGFQGYLMEMFTVKGTMSASEIEQCEGYLAHKWGQQGRLPSGSGGHPHYGTDETSAPGYTASGTPVEIDNGLYTDVLKSTSGIISKYRADSGLQWAVAAPGVGHCVVVDDNNGVYTCGSIEYTLAQAQAESDTAVIQEKLQSVVKYTDGHASGPTLAWRFWDDFINDATVAAKFSSGQQTIHSNHTFDANDYQVYPAVDAGYNFYLPHHPPEGSAGRDGTLYKIDSSGDFEWEYDNKDVSESVVGAAGYFCAYPPTPVDFDDDTIKEPEFLYVGFYNDDDVSEYTLSKLRMVDQTRSEGASRTTRLVVVANGDIKTLDRSTDTVATPTGGSGALDSTATFVDAARLFGKVYVTDGINAAIYDNKEDEVSSYVPTSGGELPAGPSLVSTYNGRLVWARFRDNANEWLMTKVNDPLNIDTFPPVTDGTEAVLGTDSRAGPCPDIIQGICPYRDDVLIMGGDQTIHQMTGDPAAGGRFDLVTDRVGFAFGRAWCKAADGRVYFMSNEGGVYVIVPGSTPGELAVNSIRERFIDVNLATYRPELQWNERQKMLHVWFVPVGTLPVAVTQHYAWDARTNSWWQDEYAVVTLEPTATAFVDGDNPGDRAVLIGSQDGRIRKLDVDSKDDDTSAVSSSVLIGPVTVSGLEHRLSHIRPVLDTSLDGFTLRTYGSDDPQAKGSVRHTATISAGVNQTVLKRTRGRATFIEVLNSASGESWSIESLTGWRRPVSRERDRS